MAAWTTSVPHFQQDDKGPNTVEIDCRTCIGHQRAHGLMDFIYRLVMFAVITKPLGLIICVLVIYLIPDHSIQNPSTGLSLSQ